MRGRATFARFATAPRHRRGPVSMVVLPRPETHSGRADPPRVAYAVGKRVGPAVVRNRVRRRLRACVQANRAALEPGASYLIGASSGAGPASFSELERAVRDLLKVPLRP